MLSRQEFEVKWKELPNESHTPETLDAAWIRYQHVFEGPPDAPFATPLLTAPTYVDPDAAELRTAFDAGLDSLESIESWQVFEAPGNRPPWTPTGLQLRQNQYVTTLATGRVWRNHLLDFWLGPQFGLWFKVGVDGSVFNGMSETNTVATTEEGELYVGLQFPGQFSSPQGGRIQRSLSTYDDVDGGYNVVIIIWKSHVTERNIREKLEQLMATKNGGDYGLIKSEVTRLKESTAVRENMPQGWSFLWFLGQTDQFTETVDPSTEDKLIHCQPHVKAGIIQKSLSPAVKLSASTVLSWDWLVTALPSRLREDLTIGHDYVSIAVEFEDGRDLTYFWSWDLPINYGFLCPLVPWGDREAHVVLRSGTQDMGKWLAESRNIYDDYIQYFGNGTNTSMPSQIVRVWLMARSRWQRHLGDMTVRRIKLSVEGEEDVKVL